MIAYNIPSIKEVFRTAKIWVIPQGETFMLDYTQCRDDLVQII